ncbi:MAG: Ig-like domain repeat protein [Chloracidobacterium sp.]|nr:Ig-like domain repeat protein [Chloracidobacterium sp.]
MKDRSITIRLVTVTLIISALAAIAALGATSPAVKAFDSVKEFFGMAPASQSVTTAPNQRLSAVANGSILTEPMAPRFFQGGSANASLTALGTAYTQNFDTLLSSGGPGNNTTNLPTGWEFSESGSSADSTYTVGTGSLATGDTLSFGIAGTNAVTDRAFGGLQSGSVIPTIGAGFTNNTGSTISAVSVTYTGEEWRLGTAARTDQINFEYSTNASSLTTGTWTAVSALNFVTPTTTTIGAKDGNAAANRTTGISSTISGLSIANGGTVWIRWTDTNASGADDGLAVDDFSLTPKSTPTASITNSPQTYTGSAQTATVSCLGGGTATLASGGTGTNAGSYAATVDCAVSSGYVAATGLSAGNFVINPASQSTLTVNDPGTVIYGSTPQLATTGGSGTGAITFSHGASTGCTVTSGGVLTVTNPNNSCSVTASKAADTNYLIATSAARTITLAKATPTASATPLTATYDGGQKSTVASCLGGGTASNLRYDGSTTAPTNAGSYPLLVDCAASTNYNAATNLTAGTFVINPVTPTVTVTVGSYTYNGSEQGPDAYTTSPTGDTGAPTWSYVGVAPTSYGPSATRPTNAGTYTATVSLVADTNFNAASSSATAFSIAKASQATVTLSGVPSSANVGDSFTAVGADGSGTGAFSYAVVGTACTVHPTTGAGSVLHVSGGCSVTATRAADDNYLVSAPSAASDITSISPGSQSITFTQPTTPAAYNSIFAIAPTASSGLPVTVTPSGGCSYLAPNVTMTSGTTACVLTASQAGNADYNAATDEVRTVNASKIAQATLVITDPGTVTYGSSPTLVTTGGSGNGAVTFDQGGGSPGCTVTSGGVLTVVQVGAACSITATKAADANYEAATSASRSITFARATPTVNFNTTPTANFPDNPNFTASATATGDGAISYAKQGAGTCDFVSGADFTATGVGNCTVRATSSQTINYNSAFADQTTSITQTTYTITPTVTGGNGTISPSTATTVNAGANQTFNFTPTGGYQVGVVTVDGSAVPTASSYTFTNVHAARTIDVTFVPSACHVLTVGTQSTYYGATITVPVNVSTTTTAEGVLSADFDVVYDPAVIRAVHSSGNIVTATRGAALIHTSPNSTGSVTASEVAGTPGTVHVSIFDAAGIDTTGGNTLVNISFTVVGHAVVTNSPVTIASGAKFGNADVGDLCADRVDGAVSIATRATTTSVVTSLTPSTYGNNVTFTATMATSPVTPNVTGGSVTFYDGGTDCGAGHGTSLGNVSLTGNQAQLITAALGAGSHTIFACYSGSTDFDASSGTVAQVVNQADQTITFAALGGKTYGDADFAVSATASSGLAVSFASTTTSVCTVSGSTVHIVAAGDCTIRASQGGNSNYNAAPNVDRTFTVAKAATTTTVTLRRHHTRIAEVHTQQRRPLPEPVV